MDILIPPYAIDPYDIDIPSEPGDCKYVSNPCPCQSGSTYNYCGSKSCIINI